MSEGTWFRIEAPHFTAALYFNDAGEAIHSAPILTWARGKTLDFMQAYCKRKGWKMEWLP